MPILARPSRLLLHKLVRGILQAAFSLALAWGLLLFVLEPVRVQGYSMLPQLQNNELLFIDKVGFNYKPLHRGDIVVFHYPRDPRESFIKRVIGLPGDHLAIWDGMVYIDGRRLVEPYIEPRFRDRSDFSEITVPAGEYFVLGDHRNSSNDSRVWGCLPESDIYGRAVFAYWPARDAGFVN